MQTKNVESLYDKFLFKNVNKINAKEIIKEALNSVPKKEENSKELNFNFKISEQLNRIKIKALNDYLETISHKKINEIKNGFEEELDKHNKNISSLLAKSKIDLNESNKVIEKLKKQIVDLNQKINILQNHKKELTIKIKDLEDYLVDLEEKYSMLVEEKTMFDEIKKVYPGLSLSEMVLEIQMAKQGSLTMLESYSNTNKELLELKKAQKDSLIHNTKKINSLMEEINQMSIAQKEEKEMYQKQINDLNNKVDLYESRIKESDYLRNSLFYIYNILFEKIDLLKDIKIDDKFRKMVDEKDFIPNVLYEPELVSYIDLMVKRMHPGSYDKVFRECVGYLNAIVKNYFPENTNLRFRPVDIFREISNLIHQKTNLINEYKNSIKYKEMQINNMQMEYNHLKEKNDNLAKEYNTYKMIVAKSFKTNKNKTENTKVKNYMSEKTYRTIANTNFKRFNLNSKKIKNQRKGIYLKDYKFSFDIENYNKTNETKSNDENDSKVLSRNERKKRALSSFKGNSLYYKFYNKNKSAKNMKQIKIDNDKFKIEKSKKNNLKMDNGNQNTINNLNSVNELIGETNRLFLYRTRMNSFQKNIRGLGLDMVNNSIKKRGISKNLKQQIFESNSIKTFEGRIMKKLDNLISSSKVK